MSELRRLEYPISAHFCNSVLLRAIDDAISDVPVYFRQKDAEMYFYTPPLIRVEFGRQMKMCVNSLWFSPPYRAMRFDDRFLKPYTNKDLLDIFEIPECAIHEMCEMCDRIDFAWKDVPFSTPSKSLRELELAYIKACSS